MAGGEITGSHHDGDPGAFGILAEEQYRGRHDAQNCRYPSQQQPVGPRGPVVESFPPGVPGPQPASNTGFGGRAYTTHGPSVWPQTPPWFGPEAIVDNSRDVDGSVDGRRTRRRIFAQLAAAAGAEEVPDELEELESEEPDELELSDFAGSLADDAPLRLSVR